jgi:hypothetical protein
MADPSVEVMDVRIEIEKALAPLLDLMRETTVLLRTLVEDVQSLQTMQHGVG